jgi:gluconate 2-dehydrogenase subunit 3-like protein
MDRREYLKLVGVATVGSAIPGCTPEDITQAAAVAGSRLPDGTFAEYAYRFFTPPEMDTIRMLADLIIPADERSGSASDARVPEFIDFTAWDRETLQIPLRGGLAWLDNTCRKSFESRFTECTPEERLSVLDRIAWPDVAEDVDGPGVAFFNLIRDMTASGFFSSEMGVRDLGYMGNTAVAQWNGCSTGQAGPSEAAGTP